MSRKSTEQIINAEKWKDDDDQVAEYPPILWRHNKVAGRAYFNLYNGETIKSSHIKQKGTQHVYMYK